MEPVFNRDPIFNNETFHNDEERKNTTAHRNAPTFGEQNDANDSLQTNGMISVDALMLTGLMHCKGTNKQKAKAFYIIV